jgi:asparagine synthase (glutamine-hydrolysing)
MYVRSADACDVIPKLPLIYDEPFADSSQIPTILVAELARRHVTVSLSGDGGDELFGGYPRYGATSNAWRLLRNVPAGVRRVFAEATDSTARGLVGASLRALAPFLDLYGRSPSVGARLNRAGALLRAPTGEDLYRAMLAYWPRGAEPALRLHDEARPTALDDPRVTSASAPFTGWMMYVDTMMYLPDDILVKVDRASMSTSLEARIPLLDHRVVEFAWTLPRNAPGRRGRTKWPLRQVLYRHVPSALIERRKMGFGVPIGDWLRGPLREWAEGLLAASRLSREGFFDAEAVRQRWDEHTRGNYDWGWSLWGPLMFQAWLETGA